MTTPNNDYELIAALAHGVGEAERAGDPTRAREIAATLAQAVHTAAVLPYRLDHDDAPTAAILHENGRIDAGRVRELLG